MTDARIEPGFDVDAWSRLDVASPLHGSAWLTVMSSRLPGAPYTIIDGNRLGFVGVVVSDPDAYESYNPYAVLWREPPVFDLEPGPRASALLDIPHKPDTTLPALVLVAPGYSGDPAGPSAGDAPAVEAMLRTALDWCDRHGLAGLHVLYTTSTVVADAVASLGGATYPITTRSVLPVWWDDWDGYLGGLSNRRRREIGRQARRAHEAGLAVEVLDVRSDFDTIVDGRCALLVRYGQQADVPAERRRLAALADAFGDRLEVFGTLLGRTVVASAVCVTQSRQMNVVYAGAGDLAAHLPYAHFLATFHGPIMHRSRRDLDEIDYGIGHSEGKLLRGCRPQQLYGHAIAVDKDRQALLDEAAGLLSDAYAPVGPSRVPVDIGGVRG